MKFLNRVLTRNITDQKVGQSRYSLVCNEAGGVLDDVIISKDVKHWISSATRAIETSCTGISSRCAARKISILTCPTRPKARPWSRSRGRR